MSLPNLAAPSPKKTSIARSIWDLAVSRGATGITRDEMIVEFASRAAQTSVTARITALAHSKLLLPNGETRPTRTGNIAEVLVANPQDDFDARYTEARPDAPRPPKGSRPPRVRRPPPTVINVIAPTPPRDPQEEQVLQAARTWVGSLQAGSSQEGGSSSASLEALLDTIWGAYGVGTRPVATTPTPVGGPSLGGTQVPTQVEEEEDDPTWDAQVAAYRTAYLLPRPTKTEDTPVGATP